MLLDISSRGMVAAVIFIGKKMQPTILITGWFSGLVRASMAVGVVSFLVSKIFVSLELSLPQVEKWIRIYPALKMAVEKAGADHEHRMIQLAEQHAAKDGKLAIAILERRHSQWNKTEKQEVKQSATGTVSPELLKALTAAPERVKPARN